MEAINDFNERTLARMDIHELRDMARALGVASPTSKKKDVLIEDILAIVYGRAMPEYKNANRGRPAKNNFNFNFAPNAGSFGVTGGANWGYGNLVASPGEKFVVDKRTEPLHGIVIKADGEYILRKYKFMSSPSDIKLSAKLVARHNLCPNDTVDYVRDENGDPVVLGVQSAQSKAEVKKIGGLVIGKRNLVYVNSLHDKQLLLAKLSEIDQIIFLPSNAVSKFAGNNLMIMPLTDMVADEMINSFFACCDIASFYKGLGKSVVLISDNMLNILTALKQLPTKEGAELERKVIASIEKLVTQEITFAALIPSIVKNVANNVSAMFDNELRM